jgi:hypothetical protein
MLNDVEYENEVGNNSGKTGGYYVNGYSVMEGQTNVYIKVYTFVGGEVAIEEDIWIDKASDKVVKYYGFNDVDLLPDTEEEEMNRRLMSLVNKRINRLTNIVIKLEDADNQEEEDYPLKEYDDMGMPCWQCKDCEGWKDWGEMCCGWEKRDQQGLCVGCMKMDEACLCWDGEGDGWDIKRKNYFG